MYHTVVYLVLVGTLTQAVPVPGRIPKVYNALITSNQNLEPSKAFPVYQPVLQNALPFPYQPVVYGDLPLASDLLPAAPALPELPKEHSGKTDETPKPSLEAPVEAPASEQKPPEESNPVSDAGRKPNVEKEAAPPPPITESPIPLNQFGLPPQIVPLGRINPDYGLTQFNSFPYTYSYPGFRFYDPFLPFSYNPYPSYPIYRPLNNFISQYSPKAIVDTPIPPASTPADKSTPPSEPSDLNVLNYASKDPAIPNVPPPPLPQGGLKTNEE